MPYGVRGQARYMEFRPIKTWAYPGALLDALIDTRRVVSAVELPLPTGREREANELMERMLDQLDHHLIPRVREESSPAIVIVGGPTGAGKSTVVNALLGEELTASGVLRPTTKVPHLFHHPLDAGVLSDVAARARVQPSEAVPRGLAIVDSPDLDSVRGENRDVAEDLLEAADLWLFVTTPARYGDAIPWNALRKATDRGASVAVVLNRVTADVAAHIRRELVTRLTEERLAGLPLFVIPENARADIPRDVMGGLGRWLDTVAAASASTIVERTLHGGIESMKEWLEELAEFMDDQAAAAKDVRAEVRRCAAQAEVFDGPEWYTEIGRGPVDARWRQATADRGPLFRLSNSVWVKRRSAREARDAELAAIRADLIAGVEAALAHAASSATDRMMDSLNAADGGVGPWLAQQRDPRDARVARERRAADAARAWLTKCESLAGELRGAANGRAVVGDDGLAVTLASAAVGVDKAAGALAVLTGDTGADAIAAARTELAGARRYVINKEALDMMKPTDILSLSPDASSKVRLRRAELRALL
jgi:GTPase SAR1 family protein